MAEFESIPVDVPGDDGFDEIDVFEVLPTGAKVFSVSPLRESYWVTTDKIEEIPGDDATGPVFRKTASGHAGYEKLRAAFEAENLMHAFVPEFIPCPINNAPYRTHPGLSLYVCKFVDMTDKAPDPAAWARAAAILHKNSMDKSPEGEFGFNCTTYSDNIPVDCIWDSSWEVVWTFQMKKLLEQDKALHGLDEKYSKLQDDFFRVVVPKYLSPLESNGRSITPCLLHLNLWRGNIKPRANSDTACVMLNSAPCWGHHEAELGVCRNSRYGLGEPYIEEYLKRMPISEPAEDFDTRNAIYAVRHHVLLSLIHYKDLSFRQIAIKEMKQLVEKATSTISK